MQNIQIQGVYHVVYTKKCEANVIVVDQCYAIFVTLYTTQVPHDTTVREISYYITTRFGHWLCLRHRLSWQRVAFVLSQES